MACNSRHVRQCDVQKQAPITFSRLHFTLLSHVIQIVSNLKCNGNWGRVRESTRTFRVIGRVVSMVYPYSKKKRGARYPITPQGTGELKTETR